MVTAVKVAPRHEGTWIRQISESAVVGGQPLGYPTPLSRIIAASSNGTIRCAASAPCDAAACFCTTHGELRDHLRSRQRLNEAASLAAQRHLFQERGGEVCALLQAA